jgi:hypothetical protein
MQRCWSGQRTLRLQPRWPGRLAGAWAPCGSPRSSAALRARRRVVHIPSLTVFSNWPTSKSPLHYVHSAAFSPNSGYLAIGNARGRVLLYRLHHYSKA